MDCRIVTILLVLGVCLVAHSEACSRKSTARRPTNTNTTRPVLCRNKCGYTCGFSRRRFRCTLRCYPVCGRKRRDITEDNGVEIFLPRDPSGFDENKDGSIDLNELAKFLSLTPSEVEQAFRFIDTNNNSSISKGEWHRAPFHFLDDNGGESGDNSSGQET